MPNSSADPTPRPWVVVVGGGPGGMMAAERLAAAGCRVTLVERMPSLGRKFLLAGRGGLNLTHSEPTDRLLDRYRVRRECLAPAIAHFDATALRAWAQGLGEPTFVGSSGRVFPESFRATPLLRAWIGRLEQLGVEIRVRCRWTGFVGQGTAVGFVDGDGGELTLEPDAVVLALGGASWPNVGSDGAWVEVLASSGVAVASLRPANCGLRVAWTDVFRDRFEGAPLKNVTVSIGADQARGEAVVTASGLEGGVIYAVSATARDMVERDRTATLLVDLRPDLSVDVLTDRLARRRPKETATARLARAAGLPPVAIGLLREAVDKVLPDDAGELAALVKATPVTVNGVEPLARAISTAGGVEFEGLDERFMLRSRPGVYVVGEMLDWEAPTGGYLLQATFSTAVWVADAVAVRLGRRTT